MLRSYQVLKVEFWIETVSECPLYCRASTIKTAFISRIFIAHLYCYLIGV